MKQDDSQHDIEQSPSSSPPLSPSDEARELAVHLDSTAQLSAEVAREGLQLAEELHAQGKETDEQLMNARELAARAEQVSEKLRHATKKVMGQE